MKKTLALAGSLAAIGAIVAVVYARDPTRHEKREMPTVHAKGIDRGDAGRSMITMLNALEGATPCETTYLAVEAEQADARLRGGASMFSWVAAKDVFLAECAKLPLETQQCMMPRYRRDHAECHRAKPPADVLAKLIVAAPVPEETTLDHPPELEAAQPQR